MPGGLRGCFGCDGRWYAPTRGPQAGRLSSEVIMPVLLDYQTPAPPPPKSFRSWLGVLVASAVGSAFVSWGLAAQARNGPLPGELGLSTFLACASLSLQFLTIRRGV